MKKRLIQLSALVCLMFVGMLGMDLASEAKKGLILQKLFSETEARGCGSNYLNPSKA